MGCDKCVFPGDWLILVGGCERRMLARMSSVCHRGQLHLFSICGLEDEGCSTLAWSMQEEKRRGALRFSSYC